MIDGAGRSIGTSLSVAIAPFAVEGATQRVHDPPEQRFADRHVDHLAGAEDGIARLDLGRGVEKHAADQIGIQYAGEPDLTALKPQNLVEPHVAQPRDHRHTVADLLDTAPVLGSRTKRSAAHRAPRGGKPVRRVRPHA